MRVDSCRLLGRPGVTALEHELFAKVRRGAASEQSCCRSQVQVWPGTLGGPKLSIQVCSDTSCFLLQPSMHQQHGRGAAALGCIVCCTSCTGSDWATCNASNRRSSCSQDLPSLDMAVDAPKQQPLMLTTPPLTLSQLYSPPRPTACRSATSMMSTGNEPGYW